MKRLLVIICLCSSSVFGDGFGTETIGGFALDTRNRIGGGKFQCPADGITDSVKAYVDVTGSRTMRVLIYRYDAGQDTSLVASSSGKVLSAGAGWVYWTVDAGTLLKDSWYLISVWSDSAAGASKADLYFDLASGTMGFKQVTYGTPPNPLSGTTNQTTRDVSIYCYYTPTVTGPPQQRHGGVHHSLIGVTNIH